MGIKGFYKLLGKYSKYHKVPISEYSGMTVSIDTSIQFYKFRIAMLTSKGVGLSRDDGKITSHIIGLFSKTLMLLKYNIIPVWVFDGKPPDLKADTIKERKSIKKKAEKRLKTNENITDNEKLRLMRQTISIKNEHISDAKKMFSMIGVPVIQANKDAEAQCAANEIAEISDATISDDSDYFLFGGKRLIRNIVKNEIIEYRLEDILNDLKLTREELINLSIILGTDYAPGIRGLGTIHAYELFMKFDKNVEKMIDYLKYYNAEGIKEGREVKFIIPDGYLDIHKKAKEYYLYTKVVNPYQLNVEWNKPNYDSLTNFLKENQLNPDNINKRINELKELYNKHIALKQDTEWSTINYKKKKKV